MQWLWISLFVMFSSSVWAQSSTIGATQISILIGDVTQQKTDAIMVPHFDGAISWGGVGAAVSRSGGSDGLNAAEQFLESHDLSFGDAFVTVSPTMGMSLVNVISVGAAENEFAVIQKAVINGLDKASLEGLKSVAIPALGTGIVGNLTATQSAQAILSAIHLYAANGGPIEEIKVVIYGDTKAYSDFVSVLNKKSYEKVDTTQVGEREFDFERYRIEMEADHGVIIVPIGEVTASCEDVLSNSPKDEKKASFFGRFFGKKS